MTAAAQEVAHKLIRMSSSSSADSDSESCDIYPSGVPGASKTTFVDRYHLPAGKYFVGNITGLTACGSEIEEKVAVYREASKKEDESEKKGGEDEDETTIGAIMGWSDEIEKLFHVGTLLDDVVVKQHKGEDVYIFGILPSNFEQIHAEVMHDMAMRTQKSFYGANTFFVVSEALLPSSVMDKIDPEQEYGFYVEFNDGTKQAGVDVRIVHREDEYGLIVCESFDTILRLTYGPYSSDYPDPMLMPEASWMHALPDRVRLCTTDLMTLFVALHGQLSDNDETPLPEHLADILNDLGGRGDDRNNGKAYHEVAVELALRFVKNEMDRERRAATAEVKQEQRASKKRKCSDDE